MQMHMAMKQHSIPDMPDLPGVVAFSINIKCTCRRQHLLANVRRPWYIYRYLLNGIALGNYHDCAIHCIPCMNLN